MRMQESKGKYFLRTMCIIHIAVCKVVDSQINISLNFSESCCFTCVLFFYFLFSSHYKYFKN